MFNPTAAVTFTVTGRQAEIVLEAVKQALLNHPFLDVDTTYEGDVAAIITAVTEADVQPPTSIADWVPAGEPDEVADLMHADYLYWAA